MYRDFLILLCVLLNYARAAVEEPLVSADRKFGHIVGGSRTSINSVPYLVSVRRKNVFVCGGSILNHRMILSAAHCFHIDGITVSARYVSIQYGVSKIDRYTNVINAGRLVVHEQFSNIPSECDIALVVLVKPIQFGVAWPIELADESPVGGTATISGWGDLTELGEQSTDLMWVHLEVMPSNVCVEQYAKMFTTIPEGMVCAGQHGGGKDACLGDSGGPLEHGGKLAGIVSFGSGCGDAEFFGIYTNIFQLRPWIESNIQKQKLISVRRMLNGGATLKLNMKRI